MTNTNLMTDNEIHSFGVEIVAEYLIKDGYAIESVSKDFRINPQIIARKGNNLVYVVVRTDCYPNKGIIEDLEVVNHVILDAKKYDASCYFASVGIANAQGITDLEMSIPTKGSKYFVSYSGLEKLTPEIVNQQTMRIKAFNKEGMIAGGVERTREGKYILFSDDKADFSSLIMASCYIFTEGLDEYQKYVFSRWADLPLYSWTKTHRDKCALALLHYFMELKSQGGELPKELINAIGEFPVQPLPPLQKPLTDETRSLFRGLFVYIENRDSRLDYIHSKWQELIQCSKHRSPQAQAILNSSKPIKYKYNTLTLGFNGDFALQKAIEMSSLYHEIFKEVLGFSVQLQFVKHKMVANPASN